MTTHPNMGTPIVNRQGEYEATSFEAGAEVASVELEPFKDFEFDLQTNRLRVAGYTLDEVDVLLRLYREHLKALAEFAQEQTAARNSAPRDRDL